MNDKISLLPTQKYKEFLTDRFPTERTYKMMVTRDKRYAIFLLQRDDHMLLRFDGPNMETLDEIRIKDMPDFLSRGSRIVDAFLQFYGIVLV